MVEMVFELIEPETLADFQRRGSASASGSMICIGEIKLNRRGRKKVLFSIRQKQST